MADNNKNGFDWGVFWGAVGAFAGVVGVVIALRAQPLILDRVDSNPADEPHEQGQAEELSTLSRASVEDDPIQPEPGQALSPPIAPASNATPPYELVRSSRSCGARVVSHAGIATMPIGGVDVLLNPGNSDCAFSGVGQALTVDVELCPNTPRVSNFTVIRNSQHVSGSNSKSRGPIDLAIAGDEGVFRPLANASSFDTQVNFTSDGVDGVRRVRFELGQRQTSGSYRQIMCSISVR